MDIHTVQPDTLAVITQYAQLAQYVVAILGIVGGAFFGYLALSKSLKQDMVKAALEKLNKSHQAFQEQTLKFIEKWSNLPDEVLYLTTEQVEDLLKDCNNLLHSSLGCSNPVANLAVLLKWTLEKVVHINKDHNKNEPIERRLLQIISHTTDRILMFTTKQVAFPSLVNLAFFTRKPSLYVPKVQGFIVDKPLRVYSFLDVGVNLLPLQGEVISFQSEINRLGNPLFSVALYRIINSPLSIAALLALHEVYFPPVLRTTKYDDWKQDDLRLVLVGFKSSVSIGGSDGKFAEFYYASDRDSLWIGSTFLESFDISSATDDFLVEAESALPKCETRWDALGIIVVKVDWKSLSPYSIKKLPKLKRRLKKERRTLKRQTT